MPGDVWKVLIYAMGCARRSHMDKYLTKETFFFDYLKTWSLVSKLITILGGQLQQFIEHKLETYIVARQKEISILPNHMRVDLQ